jgi:hypothetical protein
LDKLHEESQTVYTTFELSVEEPIMRILLIAIILLVFSQPSVAEPQLYECSITNDVSIIDHVLSEERTVGNKFKFLFDGKQIPFKTGGTFSDLGILTLVEGINKFNWRAMRTEGDTIRVTEAVFDRNEDLTIIYYQDVAFSNAGVVTARCENLSNWAVITYLQTAIEMRTLTKLV